ncbi:MAG: transcriptional regulator, LytTr family [Bacteroidetes bacterium]|nr:transcriptional regulator, LytTr family [Bacteroidota bacterium]
MAFHLKTYLNQKFPYFENGIHKGLISFFFSLFIFLFLIIFKPTFGNEEMEHLSLFTISGLSIISFLSLLFNLFIVPKLFKKWFNPINWTVRKTILFSLEQIVVIALANYIFLFYFETKLILFFNFFSIFALTALIGFIPLLILIVYIEKHQQYKNHQAAQYINKNLKTFKPDLEDPKMTFWASNNIDHLELYESQLLYIKSEGNYIRVVYHENKVIRNKMLRQSLSAMETLLSDFRSIKRVHRFYIVNLNTPISVKGNAKNCYIQFQDFEMSVPISRSFYKNFPTS